MQKINSSNVQQIQMDKLIIGEHQVRVTNTAKNTADLARSIDTVGLLQPILVAKTGAHGMFEILAGQRRHAACVELGWVEIPAIVIDDDINEIDAKIISLTENLIRENVVNADTIAACNLIYQQSGGSTEAVHKVTGFNHATIDRYTKFPKLKQELKDLVLEEGVNIDTALRAQQASLVKSSSGEVDIERAVYFAKEMEGMSAANQTSVVRAVIDNPDADPEDVIEDARTGKKITQITVTLGTNAHNSLQGFARDEDVSQDDAALSLITDGLVDKGYLGEDES